MMLDLPARLLIAYGLIALMVLAAVAVTLWLRHNSPPRRHRREKARTDARYLRRRQAAAEGPAERGARS